MYSFIFLFSICLCNCLLFSLSSLHIFIRNIIKLMWLGGKFIHPSLRKCTMYWDFLLKFLVFAFSNRMHKDKFEMWDK